MNDESAVNPHFAMLVAQLQGAAWIHMGKVANPTTGKIERNLELARGAIDMLGMLEEKTRGNLAHDEEMLLRELLRQLRLNYVSEKDKPEAAPSDDAQDDASHDEAPSDEEASESTKKDAADTDTKEAPPGS
jgi:hypothetical protein